MEGILAFIGAVTVGVLIAKALPGGDGKDPVIEAEKERAAKRLEALKAGRPVD
jgi:hypothetical protein